MNVSFGAKLISFRRIEPQSTHHSYRFAEERLIKKQRPNQDEQKALTDLLKKQGYWVNPAYERDSAGQIDNLYVLYSPQERKALESLSHQLPAYADPEGPPNSATQKGLKGLWNSLRQVVNLESLSKPPSSVKGQELADRRSANQRENLEVYLELQTAEIQYNPAPLPGKHFTVEYLKNPETSKIELITDLSRKDI